MTPYEVLDVLELIKAAPPEAVRAAHDTYNRMEINEKIPVMSRARGFVSAAFGNLGINVLTIDCRRAAWPASKGAGYADHYDHRCIEICAEITCEALMAKPYLKPSEFQLLMRPFGPMLGSPWTDEDGCATEAPPVPADQGFRNESAVQRKARLREEKRHTAEDARAERQRERAEKRIEKLKAKRGKPKPEPETTLAHTVEAEAIDLVSAALSLDAAQKVFPAKFPKPKPEPTPKGVRIFWAKRYSKWLLLVPAPSMAMATSDRFDTQDAAREFADANGWPIIGVMIPRTGGPQ